MKLNVNLGNELKHAKIDLPKRLPVFANFDNTKYLGEAVINRNGDNITAEMNIVNEKEIEKIKTILECGVSGVITGRKGKLISGFELKSVSIQFREDTKAKPKLP